jgi:hypothetical protein
VLLVHGRAEDIGHPATRYVVDTFAAKYTRAGDLPFCRWWTRRSMSSTPCD